MIRDLTLPQPILFVMQLLTTKGYHAYVVGGAVRDLLMGRSTHDWDFTTNAPPEKIQALFPGSFYDNRFGTVGIPGKQLFNLMSQHGWHLSEALASDRDWLAETVEVTTYRTEFGYSDNRRPDVVAWGKDLTEDLSRRDFTLNAIALSANLTGLTAFAQNQADLAVPISLSDPFNGQPDIETKLIRAVGDPDQRFKEDSLRMLRAIRFGAQLGFTIEAKTFAAIESHAPSILNVSWERIRDEFLKIITSPYPADGINLMANTGLLSHILPELLSAKGVRQAGHHLYDVWTHSLKSVQECPSTEPIVKFAALLHDVGKPKTYREQGPRGVTFYGHEVVGARMVETIGLRFRLSKKQLTKLITLVRWHMFVYNPEMTPASIRRFIRRVGVENINDMMLLRVGDRKGGGSQATSWRLRELQERIGQALYEPLSLKDLKVTGIDVMRELKLKPGPQVGIILNQLFEEVMADTTLNTFEALINRIHALGSDSTNL